MNIPMNFFDAMCVQKDDEPCHGVFSGPTGFVVPTQAPYGPATAGMSKKNS